MSTTVTTVASTITALRNLIPAEAPWMKNPGTVVTALMIRAAASMRIATRLPDRHASAAPTTERVPERC
jgi:hypothetical protein